MIEWLFFVLAALLVAAWIDYKTRKIPDWLVIAVFLAGMIYRIVDHSLLAGAAGILMGLVFIIPHIKGCLGKGDVKLFMALGLSAGAVVLAVIVIFTFLSLAVYLLVTGRLIKRGAGLIPFAPFILTGYVLMGGVAFVAKTII